MSPLCGGLAHKGPKGLAIMLSAQRPRNRIFYCCYYCHKHISTKKTV